MDFHESETIIHKARPYWIVFGWAVWLLYLGASFAWSANRATSRQAAQTWLILAGMFAFYALVTACIAQLYRWSSSLTLTSRRVILKNGILRQRSTEFLYLSSFPSVAAFSITAPSRSAVLEGVATRSSVFPRPSACANSSRNSNPVPATCIIHRERSPPTNPLHDSFSGSGTRHLQPPRG